MSASGVGASTSKQLKRKRNAPGSRRDPGWEYATDVDGNSKKTKCKFCSKVFSGGIFRFKHHIAKTKENVEPCLSVPDDVKLKMLQLLDFNLEAKEVRKNMLVNSPKGSVFIESLDTSSFSKNTQKVFEMLDDAVEKVGEENVLQIITDNASAYKAAGTKLMEKRKHLFWTPCAAHCLDLLLEDLEKQLPIHKTTINKGRKITNFIYGRSMLISIMKEFTKDQDLIRPAVTRFATAYLTLGCLSKHKGDLMSMFSSEKWKKSAFSSSREGKRIQGIVMDGRFWTNVHTCLCAAMPLVKVLRLVDGDDQPTMPFLYLELNQAREKIKSNFVNNEKSPLHYAAYWLNPKVHFSQGFNESERKLKVGLYDCVERFSKNSEERLTIMEQLDAFHHAKGMFSNYGSMSLLDKRNRLLQKKMNDIVYVMYNSKLLRRQAKTIERIFDEIDSDDEWVAGDDEGAENVNTEELPSTDNEPTYEVPPENDFTREPLVDNDEQVSYFTFVVVIQNVGFSLQSMILMIILNRDLKEKENSMEMRIKLKIMKMETMTT
ncbi:hypothetical protein LINGRAHAP2_LOCUS24214 [Linum grandiflorum]